MTRSGVVAAPIRHHAQPRYGVVTGALRDFVGHGVGRELHEEPQLPNFGKPGEGMALRTGMVLAIEPMVNEFSPQVRTLSDHWTAVTVDGGYSAHFEHTVLVGAEGPEILTRMGD